MSENCSTKKRIIVLICSLVVLCALTFGVRVASLNASPVFSFGVKSLIYILIGLDAVVSMKLTGINLKFDYKEPYQYMWGCLLAIVLFLLVGVIPAFFGIHMFGPQFEFNMIAFYKNIFFYFLFVGPAEELFFREFILETFKDFIKPARVKVLAVVISSLIFGFWHLINGNLIQVLFTTMIGMAFGFAKYYIKSLKLPGLAVGHGLYDFLGYVITIFV